MWTFKFCTEAKKCHNLNIKRLIKNIFFKCNHHRILNNSYEKLKHSLIIALKIQYFTSIATNVVWIFKTFSLSFKDWNIKFKCQGFPVAHLNSSFLHHTTDKTSPDRTDKRSDQAKVAKMFQFPCFQFPNQILATRFFDKVYSFSQVQFFINSGHNFKLFVNPKTNLKSSFSTCETWNYLLKNLDGNINHINSDRKFSK